MKIVRGLVWAAVIVAAVAFFAVRQMSAGEGATKGALGRLPSFSLLDQNGRVVTDHALRGRLAVINFVYTRCSSVCPMLTAKLKMLQGKLRDVRGVQYVSISVDPEHDTPAVLKEYAARFQAAPEWLFLTGPLSEIERTVVQGFKLHVGKPTPNTNNPSLIDIMHGEHFVLVDRDGTIRGYYRSDEAGMGELMADVRAAAR
jgi:protein SCO1